MSEKPEKVFFDNKSGRQMKLVEAGPYAGWICWLHPDGQWVTLRKATPQDIADIERAVNEATTPALAYKSPNKDVSHYTRIRNQLDEAEATITTLRRQLAEAEAERDAARRAVVNAHERPGFQCRCVFCEAVHERNDR